MWKFIIPFAADWADWVDGDGRNRTYIQDSSGKWNSIMPLSVRWDTVVWEVVQLASLRIRNSIWHVASCVCECEKWTIHIWVLRPFRARILSFIVSSIGKCCRRYESKQKCFAKRRNPKPNSVMCAIEYGYVWRGNGQQQQLLYCISALCALHAFSIHITAQCIEPSARVYVQNVFKLLVRVRHVRARAQPHTPESKHTHLRAVVPLRSMWFFVRFVSFRNDAKYRYYFAVIFICSRCSPLRTIRFDLIWCVFSVFLSFLLFRYLFIPFENGKKKSNRFRRVCELRIFRIPRIWSFPLKPSIESE